MSLPSRIAACVSETAEWIRKDPEFANWLEREYKPISGGWQY